MRRPPPSGMVRNLVLMIRRRKADDFDRTHDQIFRGPMPAEDGLAKSRPDRFCRFSAIRAAGGVLPVHARWRIACARADFDRFSEISENRGIEWWSRRDLNPSETPESPRIPGTDSVPMWLDWPSLPLGGAKSR